MSSYNSKRIAKNTVLLYIRLMLVMAVSLFTSRVVLDKLGVEDYGIYNVVGGIVAMLGFLNSSMANAVQRYLSFEMGKNNSEAVNRVYNIASVAHMAIALFVFLVMEIVGVWFLNTHMNIPSDRLEAAHWVLQSTVVVTAFSILQVPANAMIIAKEQMGIYAYISILEVLLKLAIVYVLTMLAFDKLKLYSVLMAVVSIGIGLVYWGYCLKKYDDAKIKKVKDWRVLKELTGFAGWNMLGELSWAFCGQGVNLILNIFFGPAVNAARGIAEQVNGAVSRFVSNFQMAVNPQMVKTYATGEWDEMKKLLFRSTRFSYYLLFLLALPLLLNMDYILGIWLKKVPAHTSLFCRLVLICSLVSIVSSLLSQVAKANGHIRKYQIVVSLFIFLNFPFSYLVLKLGVSPECTMLVNISIQAILLFVRLYLVKDMIGISVCQFLQRVVSPIVKVTVIASIVPCFFTHNATIDFLHTLVSIFLSIFSVAVTCYFFGIGTNERKMVQKAAIKIVRKIK